MVLCLVALVVFGILGVFSAKYRQLAKEAFGCFFTTITLRPCQTNFDEKIKGTIIARALEVSPKIAGVINRNYVLLTWLFTAVFFASLAYSALGVYNYWAYGNCNGPDSSGFCALDVLLHPGQQNSFGSVQAGVGPIFGQGNITLIEFGCFTCPFTASAQSALKEFLVKNAGKVKLEFRAFNIPKHAYSKEAAEAAFCALDEGGEPVFWSYYDQLFAHQKEITPDRLKELAVGVGLSQTSFNECFDSHKFAYRVDSDSQAGKDAGVYGTPTFFIGESVLIGPKTVSEFEDALAGKTVVNNATSGASCPATTPTTQ